MKSVRLDRMKLYVVIKARDLTQKEAADKAGVSHQTMYSITGGKSCSPDTAKKIANALGMKVEDLVED